VRARSPDAYDPSDLYLLRPLLTTRDAPKVRFCLILAIFASVRPKALAELKTTNFDLIEDL